MKTAQQEAEDRYPYPEASLESYRATAGEINDWERTAFIAGAEWMQQQQKSHVIAFNEWLEEFTVRDDGDKVTMYLYDGSEGMQPYILEDIYDLWAGNQPL